MIDDYLSDLDAHLRVSKRDRARVMGEVRDHLDDAVAQGLAENLHPDLADARAVSAFGSAALIATEFNAVAGTRAMRRATAVALTAGIAVVLGFLIAVTTQPRSRGANGASIGAQVSFFAAALALQIAVVAGGRAASRVLAVGRTAAAPAVDRQLVHRCVVTCITALCITAIGWAVCIGLAANSLANPNRATLAAGAAFMIGTAAIAAAVTTRLDVNPGDDATDAQRCTGGLLGMGDRGVDVVRRHPVVVCAALAGVAGLAAMSHAETTVAAALPWGALQAAAVVLGYLVLGRSLGLREARTT